MILYLKDILELIEEIAPHELSEPWDNPGLQVGAPRQQIKTIYFALDPTFNSIQKAIKYDADLIITHHPLIFRSISRLSPDTYPGNVIKEALGHNISIVSIHTNLDAAPGGIKDIVGEMRGREGTEVLKGVPGVEAAGLGRIGNLSRRMGLRDFLEWAKGIFGLSKIRVVCDSLDRDVGKVAVLGGSGGSLVSIAAQKEADVFITGDIGYHDALNALSHGLVLVDAGHFSTEDPAYRIFGKKFGSMLRDRGFEVEVLLDHEESDPFCII